MRFVQNRYVMVFALVYSTGALRNSSKYVCAKLREWRWIRYSFADSDVFQFPLVAFKSCRNCFFISVFLL